MAQDVLALIKRGTEEILPESELAPLLKSGKSLCIKVGFDPTAPDLHLGHTVLLNKMRHFQDCGHEVIFLIGDFTGMIGDPSGKNKTRPPLTQEEVQKNAETYRKQVFKILIPKKTKVVLNSEWMSRLSARDLIELASRETVARMLERDDFSKRFHQGEPIAIHEFLYPLLQGYDSIALHSDIEMGGTDQKFNMLMGRTLQKQMGQTPQVVITVPLLEGLDGVQKMSKSLGNTVAIRDPPKDMFGKLMSISDLLMWRYYDLLSFRSTSEIEKLKVEVAAGKNPRDVKAALAKEIIERFHSQQAALEAEQDFIARFREHALPQDIPERKISTTKAELLITHVLKEGGLVTSTSDAIRMIRQKAVHMDGQMVSDPALTVPMGLAHVYQVGKRRVAKIEIVRSV
ncbi:MAG: tyrosine--tRNA ligase [Gammaproteobacteria bacterium]|nr:tyrosine--tRNA ligase [Gammaproteobacteria bacterium]